jgi:hypothetical protein
MTTAGAVMNLPNRMNLFVAAIFMILFAEAFLAGRASRAAEDCISEPNAAAPEGSHWYYRVDRTTQQKCWHLRPEGIKGSPRTQQATSAVRPPPSTKPVLQPIAQMAAVTAPVAAPTGEAKPAEDDFTVPVSSIETSGLGRPNQSTLGKELMPSRLADEHSAPEATDETPAVRPITTPSNMTTAERSPESTVTFAYLVAIIAAVLGLVAIMGRIIFGLPAVRRFGRAKPRGFGRGSRLPRLDTEAPSKFSNAAAAAHYADILRTKGRPMPQVSDSAGEIEASVRQLLQELLRRQDECRPTRTKSSYWSASVDHPVGSQHHRARYDERTSAFSSL